MGRAVNTPVSNRRKVISQLSDAIERGNWSKHSKIRLESKVKILILNDRCTQKDLV